MLTVASHHSSRYDTTTTDWDSIKNSINAPDVTFACLAIANLHYGSFGELVEGLSPLPISDLLEDHIVGTHYRQYGELMAGFHPTSDRDRNKKDTLDVDENDGKRAADDKVVDDGAADDGVAENKAANDDDNQGESNNQNSDRDYMVKQKKPSHLGKGFFLDKTWSRTLVIPEKAVLYISEGVKSASNIDKKLTR